jgi:ribose transport system substrate-binding protein
MEESMTRTWRPWLAAAAAATLLAACGSSSSSSTNAAGAGGAAQTQTSSSAGTTGLSQAEAALAEAYAGTDRSLPTANAPVPKGKTVWVLSCSEAAPGCAVPAAAAVQAGTALGWHMKVLDGKFDPVTWNTLIRSAAAAHPDALILDAVDCAATQASLQAARQAGVKIFGFYSFDCNDRYTGGPSVFNAALDVGSTDAANSGSYADFIENTFAKAQAAYAIAKTGGHADIIQFYETDVAVAHHIGDGYNKWIKAWCPGCTINQVQFTGQDLITGKLQEKATAALTRYPTANVVAAPYDATILLGIGPAVATAKASGRKLLLTGGEGLAPNIALIRKGVQDFAAGVATGWVGWASIDGVIRMFDGTPQVDEGLGNGAVDQSHNLPSKTPFYDGNTKSQDYRAVYLKMWGA